MIYEYYAESPESESFEIVVGICGGTPSPRTQIEYAHREDLFLEIYVESGEEGS